MLLKINNKGGSGLLKTLLIVSISGDLLFSSIHTADITRSGDDSEVIDPAPHSFSGELTEDDGAVQVIDVEDSESEEIFARADHIAGRTSLLNKSPTRPVSIKPIRIQLPPANITETIQKLFNKPQDPNIKDSGKLTAALLKKILNFKKKITGQKPSSTTEGVETTTETTPVTVTTSPTTTLTPTVTSNSSPTTSPTPQTTESTTKITASTEHTSITDSTTTTTTERTVTTLTSTSESATTPASQPPPTITTVPTAPSTQSPPPTNPTHSVSTATTAPTTDATTPSPSTTDPPDQKECVINVITEMVTKLVPKITTHVLHSFFATTSTLYLTETTVRAAKNITTVTHTQPPPSAYLRIWKRIRTTDYSVLTVRITPTFYVKTVTTVTLVNTVDRQLTVRQSWPVWSTSAITVTSTHRQHVPQITSTVSRVTVVTVTRIVPSTLTTEITSTLLVPQRTITHTSIREATVFATNTQGAGKTVLVCQSHSGY